MPNWRRRYDRHSQRLFLSERLSRADQLREIAMEACLIRMRDAVAAEIEALKLSSDEARRLARFELGRYAAHALMMPYAAFHQAAVRARYDIAVLASRFGVSFEQAASRLVTLQRTGSAGVPFFLMEVDISGNRLRRAGAHGFPHAAFGGGCPKLPVHDAFAEPGRVLVEAVEMPDGTTFLCIARTVDGPQGAFDERPRRTALLLGCDTRPFGIRCLRFRSGRRADPDRPRLPALRARRLPRPRRAAGYAPARPRRDGDGPQRLRFSVNLYGPYSAGCTDVVAAPFLLAAPTISFHRPVTNPCVTCALAAYSGLAIRIRLSSGRR